jgi:hypothetical protein
VNCRISGIPQIGTGKTTCVGLEASREPLSH